MPLPVPHLKCPVCAASHTPLSGQLKNGVYAGNCQNCGFFFKFRAVEDTADTITFTVNGTQYTVGNEFDPATSLIEWLRIKSISPGTKQMCLEGGCGICMVTVKLYDPITASNQIYSINSCLVQLYSCDGWEVTTIEGLGNTRAGLHPIQQRMVQYNASQCGFCTPGQIMNMYGFLQRNPSPTRQQVEDNYDATLCRCTGYRPILDAAKSFAVDAPPSLSGGPIDIEDLNPKLCKTSGKPCTGRCGSKGDSSGPVDMGKPLHIVAQRAQWFKPTTMEALYALLQQYRNANYRLIFGNTGYGIYRELGAWLYDVLIDIRGIKALYNIEFDPSVVMVGANVSLTSLLELFESHSNDPKLKAYFPDFAVHMKQVGSNAIRNVASWAGNLMLKNKHPFFISNVFTMLETVGTNLYVVDSNSTETRVSLGDFLKLDMKGKVITAAALPTYTTDDVYIRTFRVAQRLQMDHGYVLAGFNFRLDKDNNFMVKAQPTMVFQGINTPMNHATRTESYLNGKQLGDPHVLQGALNTLSQELNPMDDPILASPQYRHNLACALFYKFVLGVCGTKATERYHSGATALLRPVSSGVQTYSSRKEEWPLNEPMTKLEAAYQVAGEAKFLDDSPKLETELFASFVISDHGNATVASMDPSAALSMKGVQKFIQATDIPTGGKNNFASNVSGRIPEELLCSGQVLYAGQPLAIVVADDPEIAETAATLVNVTYTNVQKPITDLKEAIQQRSFFPLPDPSSIAVGNADQAITQSAHRITGTLQMGTQAHFHLETQAARCTPSDDGGMNVQATAQWIDATGEIVAGILNIPISSVKVEAQRLGGAFGAKATRNPMVAGACALAAYITQRTVRLRMNFHTNMKAVGKRHPYYAEYQVGVTDEGKLNGVEVTAYGDCGCSPNDNVLMYLFAFLDNTYSCPNWKYTAVAVKTNTPSNTQARSPGSLPGQFIIETIMDHVAKVLNKDPTDVRKINFYKQGQITPTGVRLDYCNISGVVSQVETSSDFINRKNQVAVFNQANRWKKRGISMVPTKFIIIGDKRHYNVFVAIYHFDGTIAIEHGGIEMGQGLDTKVAQVCAYELGVPLSLIRVKRASSICNANSAPTDASLGSELNAMGVIECCKLLRARMDPIRQQMNNPSWQELVTECYNRGQDLTAHCYTTPHGATGTFVRYNVYAATVTEVEVDVLTGQYQLIRVDLIYDAGESLNPELDIGQVEGGFMMGLGYHLTEKAKFDPTTGELLTDGTWEYKPPMPKDLPIDFRVTLLKNAPNPLGVLRSKATGETPLVMASSAVFAIKHAVAAARAEIGQTDPFTLNSPVLVEDVQTACLVNPANFTFGQ